MGVAERVHEIAGCQAGYFGHHQGQQRIAGNVERHAKKDICRALIELAGELTVRDVELEQAVARRQRHVRNIGWVPCRDDNAAAVRVGFQLVHNISNLIDGAAIRLGPAAPLFAVNRT